MFSFLRLLVFVALCLIGIGLYRGWFSFSKPQPEAQGGKVDISVTFNEDKAKQDLKKVEDKLGQKAKQVEDRTGAK
jgi:hypothetical protein